MKPDDPFDVRRADSEAEIAAVKRLFQDYADWLQIDLCFQGFEEEMARFPATYALLLIAGPADAPLGAVGLKQHDCEICEMKRLYAPPGGRRRGVGRALSLRLIEEARVAGYAKMVLDTFERLTAAVALYETLGFRRSAAYYDNPEPDAIFMELAL